MISTETAAAPRPMRFVKDLVKSWSQDWKAGVEVEAWPSRHLVKCHNVRLKSDPAIALLGVPDHFLEEIKPTKP